MAAQHIYCVCRQTLYKQPELMKMFVNSGAYAVTVIPLSHKPGPRRRELYRLVSAVGYNADLGLWHRPSYRHTKAAT